MPVSIRSLSTGAEAEAQVAEWTSDYAPLSGIPDEFIGPDGARREHWMRLLRQLATSSSAKIAERFAAADSRVRNRGMSYRVRGETAERVWPLSRLPLLIPAKEWREIESGVIQRAELIERVLADVYGEGKLIAEGAIPAAALTRLGRFRRRHARRQAAGRPLAAALRRRHRPRPRRRLVGARRPHAGAFGLGLRDREPARRLRRLSRALQQMNVERVAPFFRDLRAGLKSAASGRSRGSAS